MRVEILCCAAVATIVLGAGTATAAETGRPSKPPFVSWAGSKHRYGWAAVTARGGGRWCRAQRDIPRICSTDDGGKTWKPILFGAFGKALVHRASRRAGIVALNASQRPLTFWTRDNGRRWFRTDVLGADELPIRIWGRGRRVFWRNREGTAFRLAGWPPRGRVVCPGYLAGGIYAWSPLRNVCRDEISNDYREVNAGMYAVFVSTPHFPKVSWVGTRHRLGWVIDSVGICTPAWIVESYGERAVCATNDAGEHWRVVFYLPYDGDYYSLTAAIRRSRSTGLVSYFVPPSRYAEDWHGFHGEFWTVDGGRHWYGTRALDGGVGCYDEYRFLPFSCAPLLRFPSQRRGALLFELEGVTVYTPAPCYLRAWVPCEFRESGIFRLDGWPPPGSLPCPGGWEKYASGFPAARSIRYCEREPAHAGLRASPVSSPDGTGAVTVAKHWVARGSGGNTISFTYRLGIGRVHGGAVRIAVPEGWSRPSVQPADPGFSTSTRGEVSVEGSTIVVSRLEVESGETVTITYGALDEGGPGAVAPADTRVETWRVDERSSAEGVPTELGTPPRIAILEPARGSAVSVGDTHTCALTTAGVVECWGGNGAGQIGDDSKEPSLVPREVTGLPGRAVAVAAGAYHSCALVLSGDVWCWGGGERGATPGRVRGLGGSGTAIAAGGRHTCALLAGGVVECWGENAEGQLGDGSTASSPTPVRVKGLTGAVTISAGRAHTCAVTSSGVVFCWGSNDFGQLGDGTTADRTLPTKVTAVTDAATEISADDEGTCAIVDGGVSCWGWRQPAAFGIQRITGNLLGLSRGCAIASGRVVCWQTLYFPFGANPVAGITDDPISVSGSRDHSCAVVRSGAVECWGDNRFGQLGDGTARFGSEGAVPVASFGG